MQAVLDLGGKEAGRTQDPQGIGGRAKDPPALARGRMDRAGTRAAIDGSRAGGGTTSDLDTTDQHVPAERGTEI